MNYRVTTERGVIEAKTSGYWIVDDTGRQLAFIPKPKGESWSAFESQCMVVAGYFQDGRKALFNF